MLDGADLDLAVARGAAYYGLVRRGKGVRIRGGTARAYYIGIESAMPAVPGFAPPVKALCVAPFGMEEGSTRRAARRRARPGRRRAVDVPLLRLGDAQGRRRRRAGRRRRRRRSSSSIRSRSWSRADGERKAGEMVPVRLEAHVTEVGTLELWCVARDGHGRWKLEYSVRERDEA